MRERNLGYAGLARDSALGDSSADLRRSRGVGAATGGLAWGARSRSTSWAGTGAAGGRRGVAGWCTAGDRVSGLPALRAQTRGRLVAVVAMDAGATTAMVTHAVSSAYSGMYRRAWKLARTAARGIGLL